MNILNIITRCTRPENLYKVKESIFNSNNLFKINWFIVFDTNCITKIDSEILSDFSQVSQLRFIKGVTGDFGHQLINTCLDEIRDGWVYVLDDDNLLHEDFYEDINSAILNFEDKRGFIFNQKVGGRDFSGLDIRESNHQNIKVGSIDMAQFILRRDLIGDRRLESGKYVADGIFIQNLFEESKDDFIFINKVLSYYNAIESPKLNSLPRILIVGTEDKVDIKSKFINDYESQDLNILSIKDDSDIDSVISEFNPDAIISIGESFANFPKLSYHSLDIRRRWLHFNEIDTNVGESSYFCANNYILSDGDTNTPLISFFTPIYNTGEKLWRTYESVRNQDYTNWEWVLVNDSTDGGKTLEVAEEISKLDCRVKVYDFGRKSGGIIGESKYRAASLSRGKYIMELDHDDIITPDAGRLMVEAFKMYPDAKFVYSDCTEIDENHNSLTYGDGFSFGYGSYRKEEYGGRTYQVVNTPNINPVTIRHIVGVPNHFRAWDRVFYHSIGGHNRRLTIADDYELIVRSFLKTKFVCIRKMLYLQFYHNSNTQDSARRDIQRRVRSISNYYKEKIMERFKELGVNDYAYEENPSNPLLSTPRYGDGENCVNYIYYPNNTISYNWESVGLSKYSF
jgi:glycosyltransferase involved in cell wall biosynthesis